MRKRHLFVAVAIIMAVSVFITCDLIKPVDCTDDNQDTTGDLTINGVDATSTPVKITFSRPVQTAQAVEKAVVPLTPQSGDKYAIYYNDQSQPISSGDITVTGATITFNPDNGGSTFRGTYSSGQLTFIDNPTPTTPQIKDFHIENGGNGGSSEANAIVKAWGTNATAKGNEVHINGDITVLNSITISDSVKLFFDARDNNSFTIGTANTSTKVTVTVKGGIVVSEGRGVTLQGSSGTLVVEGVESTGSASTISGRLIVGERATLDFAGDVTITSGGVLELVGYRTAYLVATQKYLQSPNPPENIFLNNGSGDAGFKLRGKMSVENGGRFQMPDPWKFDVKGITGLITVKSGGELILVTADPKGYLDLHPLIGTLYTETQGFPVGADFVMNPIVDGKIEVRISGDDKNQNPNPALELTGSASALGRLILNENHRVYSGEYSDRPVPYRFEVWLTYPFTVTATGMLKIGEYEQLNLRTTLLVTGSDFTSVASYTGTTGILGIDRGINKGVLTNNGQIKILNKNAIVEWFGGHFDHNDSKGQVTDFKNNNPVTAFYQNNHPSSGSSLGTSLTFKPYTTYTDFSLWSPGWVNGIPDDPDKWWPWNGTGTTFTP